MRRFVNLSYEQRLAMGESARRKVQERFSEELVVATYLEVLAGLNKAELGA
jgi:hypothetical protein